MIRTLTTLDYLFLLLITLFISDHSYQNAIPINYSKRRTVLHYLSRNIAKVKLDSKCNSKILPTKYQNFIFSFNENFLFFLGVIQKLRNG